MAFNLSLQWSDRNVPVVRLNNHSNTNNTTNTTRPKTKNTQRNDHKDNTNVNNFLLKSYEIQYYKILLEPLSESENDSTDSSHIDLWPFWFPSPFKDLVIDLKQRMNLNPSQIIHQINDWNDQFEQNDLDQIPNEYANILNDNKGKITKHDQLCLYGIFSVLDWNENNRIIYDEQLNVDGYYASLMIASCLNNKKEQFRDSFYFIINQFLCEPYLGFIKRDQAYIIIPYYHQWSMNFDKTQFPFFALDVHGLIKFISYDIFELEQLNETERESILSKTSFTRSDLEWCLCIGWEYNTNDNLVSGLNNKPGYDLGIKITFDLVKKHILHAISTAKIAARCKKGKIPLLLLKRMKR